MKSIAGTFLENQKKIPTVVPLIKGDKKLAPQFTLNKGGYGKAEGEFIERNVFSMV